MSVVTDNHDTMLLPADKIIASTHLHLSTNQPRPLSVMVLGKPGEGKSSLLNGILGQQAFVAKLSVSVSIIIKFMNLCVLSIWFSKLLSLPI